MKRITALLLSFIFVFSFAACSKGTDDNQGGESLIPEGAHELYPGIYADEITSFSGNYPFDTPEGEEVSGLITVKVYNTTETSYQLFDFTMTVGEKEYSFSARTLLSKSSMILFDEEKSEMPEGEPENFKVTDIAAFETEPSLESEKFEITGYDSIINIKNISGEDAENVYVYYKLTSGDSLFGGVTFRVPVEKVLSGEIVQLPARWFRADGAKVLFVTYES